jgi:hypothetical protein
MKFDWFKMEAGWYVARKDEKDVGVGIAKETDGWWHLYMEGNAPGRSHSRYRSLRAAQTAASHIKAHSSTPQAKRASG